MKVDIKKTFIWFSFCLSLYIFGVAIYIEILNYRAGNFLPRTDEYRNSDPSQGLTKWRYRVTADLKGLGAASKRYANDYEESSTTLEPNAPVHSQITAESQPDWDIQVERENNLHDAVLHFGLLQYPLIFVSFICLFIALGISSKRMLHLVGIGFMLNILSLIALIGRSYFGSLGW